MYFLIDSFVWIWFNIYSEIIENGGCSFENSDMLQNDFHCKADSSNQYPKEDNSFIGNEILLWHGVNKLDNLVPIFYCVKTL